MYVRYSITLFFLRSKSSKSVLPIQIRTKYSPTDPDQFSDYRYSVKTDLYVKHYLKNIDPGDKNHYKIVFVNLGDLHLEFLQ